MVCKPARERRWDPDQLIPPRPPRVRPHTIDTVVVTLLILVIVVIIATIGMFMHIHRIIMHNHA